MWRLYCLPGRVIAEFGYLFPGRGELWASKRRRESGFAAFLFATAFWMVFAIFGLPILAGVVGGVMHGSRFNASTQPTNDDRTTAARQYRPSFDHQVSDTSSFHDGPSAVELSDRAQKPVQVIQREASPKPHVVFGPRSEVVQPLPSTEQDDRP